MLHLIHSKQWGHLGGWEGHFPLVISSIVKGDEGGEAFLSSTLQFPNLSRFDEKLEEVR